MRIVQLIQKPQARGAEIFTSQLSSALASMGHQVLLITLFEGDYELPFNGKQIHFQLSIKNRLWAFGAWKKLGGVLKDFNPDIVQANGADTLKFSVFARLIVSANYKLIFNNGGVVSYYVNSFLKKAFNQYLFRKVDGLISVSDYSKFDLDKFISTPKFHRVIPIGIELPVSNSSNIQTTYQIVVHIAGFTPEKNHEEVLQIFEKFLEIKPDSQLWLIGDGPLKQAIENLVEQTAYSEKVRFFGAISNPFSLIPKNAFLILPSKIEGVPAVILEAFYHQIPVFAYDVGGIPDLVKNLKTGMLIHYGKQTSFVNSMVNYLEFSKEQQNRLLQNAQEVVFSKYQNLDVAFRFEEFYKEVCESYN